MLFQCYLRRGIVYVPTTAKRGTSVYTAIEPVAVVSAADTAGLMRALREAIARKNVVIPPIKGKRPPPVLLKYAGVQTWSAFAREASTWNIEENEGTYQIVGHRMHPKGYWVEDAEQKSAFPPGTKVDAVIARMIAILQQASGAKAGVGSER
jgi:hypothetical protein